MAISDKRLRRISRQLSHFDLHRLAAEEMDVTAEDLMTELEGRRAVPLFLDFYTTRGLQDALERYGVWQELLNRGFAPHLVLSELDDRDMLRVTDGAYDGALVIVELVAHLVPLVPSDPALPLPGRPPVQLLVIEWLLMQNPHRGFGRRLALPGQEFPGLGLGREIMTLLQIMAERLDQEGLLAFPQHLHNGLLYDRRFRFFSPTREGELKALERDLGELGLAMASWAVEEGLVIDGRTNAPYRWTGAEMIWPHSDRLREYFRGSPYREAVAAVREEAHFRYDPERVAKLERKLAQRFGRRDRRRRRRRS